VSLHEKEPCRRLLDRLCDYLDGELDPALCADLERHMVECEACAVVVETTRHTIALYRQFGHAEVPETTLQRLKRLVERSTP